MKTKMTTSYTARSKTLDVVAKNLSYLSNPGPGNYETIELFPKNGRHKLSRFNDTKLSVINNEKRFKDRQATPGPTDYSHLDNLNHQGKYVLSQRRGKGTRPFDKEMKFTVGFWKTN